MAKRHSHNPVGIAPSLPNGTSVADFPNYAQAVAYVEQILRGDFPATAIAIVGTDLSTVERIRAKISYRRIALNGAMSGSWVGLLLYLVFGIGGTDQPVQQFGLTSAIFIGAGIGMLVQVVRFSLIKNKRTFSSGSLVVAQKYEVVVPHELTGEAATAFAKGAETN